MMMCMFKYENVFHMIKGDKLGGSMMELIRFYLVYLKPVSVI